MTPTPCPNCSWPHHVPDGMSITIPCAKCGTLVHCNGGGKVVGNTTVTGKQKAHKAQEQEPYKIECPHLNDGTCEMLSLIAGVQVKTINATCHKCLTCSRPQRLNENNIGLLPEDSIKAATEAMVSGGTSIGDDLAVVFGAFAEKKQGCGCSGIKDALNTLTVEQVHDQKKQIVSRISREAAKRGIPFAKTAVRVALESVLLKHKLTDAVSKSSGK
jgi:hypothetical protein